MTFSVTESLPTLHRYATQFLGGELPDYVTKDSLQKVASTELLPSNAFGDPGTRTFPCHSRGATYLSQLFFNGDQANNVEWSSPYPREKVAERLAKSAEHWQISEDVESLCDAIKVACTPKTPSDSDYLLAEEHKGEPVRRFPVMSKEAVSTAAATFYRDRANYPFPWRSRAARNLLQKAAEFQATGDLPEEQLDYFMKACAFVPADDAPRTVAPAIMYRAMVCPGGKGNKDALQKLAGAVRSGDCDQPMEKLCTLLDDVDRETGLWHLYGDRVQLPEEVCFGTGVVKQAGSGECIELGNGVSYSVEDIKKAGLDPYAVVNPDLSEAIADDALEGLDIEKAAAILPTLPRDEAVVLDKALRAIGLQPSPGGGSIKQAANRGNMNAFNLDEWYKFASDRGDKVHENFVINLAMNHPQRVMSTDCDIGQSPASTSE